MNDMENTAEDNSLPITDPIDVDVLMHRDAHFGGKFEFMREYYTQEGCGVSEDFDVTRIDALDALEKKLGKNLAPLLLSGSDAERVGRAKHAYKRLRALYEEKATPAHKIPKLIADLILAEGENPLEEIEAIVAEKGAAVSALLDLARSEDFHDPLFPGYGLAPARAMHCLSRIGDKRAVIALFEAIGSANFFEETIAIEGLRIIGQPAQEFLLKVLHGRPLTYDNERAAIALLEFKKVPAVAQACLDQLHTLDLKKNALLANYLILVCQGLTSPEQKRAFLNLARAPTTPAGLQKDMLAIAHEWPTP